MVIMGRRHDANKRVLASMTEPTAKRDARRPAGPRANLAEKIAADLRERVQSRELSAGDRLPTEHELARTHGVSRAVVREAIAALRSEGLVIARQGSGVFVAEANSKGPTLALLNFEPEKLSSIIEVLELRAAVESEAAALAAERCSPAELAKINECHAAVAQALAQGEQAESQDFTLHLAIAESTHNRHFVEFYRFLGGRTIPRAQLADTAKDPDARLTYLSRIHDEHSDIVKAISARDPAAARDAMRIHLKGSQARYERLALRI